MQLNETGALFARIERLSASLNVKAGRGTEWSYTFPDGETHTYRIRNIRPPEQIEDDVASLLVWTWSLKDYLKTVAVERGKAGQTIEKIANDDSHLPVCADLANLLKHGKLIKSRSGKFPSLHRVRYEMGKEAFSRIFVAAFEVEIEVARPELVDVFMPVKDSAGNPMGDALEYVRGGITRWEALYDELTAS